MNETDIECILLYNNMYIHHIIYYMSTFVPGCTQSHFYGFTHHKERTKVWEVFFPWYLQILKLLGVKKLMVHTSYHS